MSKSKLPTYKITQHDNLALTVTSNDEKLIAKTRQRWEFMMNNCKFFVADHMLDNHKFKTRRFLIVGLTEIVKYNEDDVFAYEFEAGVIEVPDDKTVFETIRDYYKENK
nr:MAG TPA: hypothetical protein [Caudoviricetes sp.]